jgi:hypothetical protein
MSPQEISKRYKRQSLGMPPRHPFFIGKNHVTFQDTIFLLLHALCVFLGASLFSLSVLFYFCCNKWLDHIMFVLERDVFRLDFCSDIVIALHQGVFRPLVYVGFHQKSCLKKV